MSRILLISLILSFFSLSAQNLVPNSGFDDLSDCPGAYAEIEKAPPWKSATNGSPDLYNECSVRPGIRVPNAGLRFNSYQLPRSGAGYAGIFVYSELSVGSGNSEYLEVPLLEPLKKNVDYYVEFYVSVDLTPTDVWRYSDAVGAAFVEGFYYEDVSGGGAMKRSADIEHAGELLTDTSNWMLINGCYTARGGEDHLIIGNFRDAKNTMFVVEDLSLDPKHSYLLIEDVAVNTFDPFPDNVVLCDDDTISLSVEFNGAAIEWSTGETTSTIIITKTGTYFVEANIKGCILRDTVEVINPDEISDFNFDVFFCNDERAMLHAPIEGEYIWSNGSDQESIIVNDAGDYQITVTNACGEYVFNLTAISENCSCNIYVPNVFTPNADGLNDRLEIYSGCEYPLRINEF